jgi:hypothetical protein
MDFWGKLQDKQTPGLLFHSDTASTDSQKITSTIPRNALLGQVQNSWSIRYRKFAKFEQKEEKISIEKYTEKSETNSKEKIKMKSSNRQ